MKNIELTLGEEFVLKYLVDRTIEELDKIKEKDWYHNVVSICVPVPVHVMEIPEYRSIAEKIKDSIADEV